MQYTISVDTFFVAGEGLVFLTAYHLVKDVGKLFFSLQMQLYLFFSCSEKLIRSAMFAIQFYYVA